MAATKKNAPALTKAQQEHLATLTTMSSKIRYLAGELKGDRGAVSRALGIRYQWVRNVLIQPLKTQG